MLHRRTIAALYILLFLCQIFSRSIITLNFYANQKNIAATLCENRNKPQLHCNGKCRLHKKLTEEANTDKQIPDRKSEGYNEVLCSVTAFAEIPSPCIASSIQLYFIRNINLVINHSFRFFHPPRSFFV